MPGKMVPRAVSHVNITGRILTRCHSQFPVEEEQTGLKGQDYSKSPKYVNELSEGLSYLNSEHVLHILVGFCRR